MKELNITDKRISILKESLGWILILAAGSWFIFRDDLIAFVATVLFGFPGAFMLVAGNEHLLAKGEQRTSILSVNSRQCLRRFAALLLIYNMVAIIIVIPIVLVSYPRPHLGGIVAFLVVELLIVAVVLLSEYLLTKAWPTPSISVLLCTSADPNKEHTSEGV